MASDEVNSLFSELRSVVASHHVLAAHEIAKSVYALDSVFHAEAIIPYLQSHSVADGAMTRDTLVRLEKFKQWVREQLEQYSHDPDSYTRVVRALKEIVSEEGLRSKRLIHYFDDGYNGSRIDLTCPPSADFKMVRGKYVLRAAWRDALWAVLDERSLW
jgi:hypothetical protein